MQRGAEREWVGGWGVEVEQKIAKMKEMEANNSTTSHPH